MRSPLLEEIAPALAVTGAVSVQFACGPVDVTVDDGRVVVAAVAGVPHYCGRVRPPKAVIFELKFVQRRRSHRQRVEGAVKVADVARHELGAFDRSAGFGLCFKHNDVPARVGE